MAAMHKMLAIAALFLLSEAAWAGALPDRSKLSYEENSTINFACARTISQGVGAFNSCVAKELVSLKDHPTPDRSGLSPSRNRAVEKACAYHRREGIAPFNDCVHKVIAALANSKTTTVADELSPDYPKMFTEDAVEDEEAQPTPAVATTVPGPASVLPARPDRIEKKALPAEEVFRKVEASVFVVLATRSMAEARVRNITQGSAVAVSEHMLLTNCHVVKDRPIIKLVQKDKRATAKLVAADDTTDRCVISTNDLSLSPVGGVRTLDSLAVGERVFAVGAPLSLELTLSEGLISAIRRKAARNLVQTSAAVSPGSSGGGLFDERGNLVGITTLASISGAQNLNFAIAAADWWK
jgi:S1-C subfamily serine protease